MAPIAAITIKDSNPLRADSRLRFDLGCIGGGGGGASG
jgi:hypothetical protein